MGTPSDGIGFVILLSYSYPRSLMVFFGLFCCSHLIVGWKFHFQIPDGGATPIRTEMADINTRAPFLPSSTVMGRRPSLPMTSLPAVVEKMGKESWDESGFGSMLSAPSSQASGLTT